MLCNRMKQNPVSDSKINTVYNHIFLYSNRKITAKESL